MKQITIKTLLITAFIVFLMGCTTERFLEGASMEQWTENYIKVSVEEDKLQGGISAMIIQEGDVLYSGGAGFSDKDKGTTISGSTPMPVGSISKIFTSVALMTLVEEGKVDLHKSVGSYLPELELKDGAEMTFTVRDLLTHHSGIQGDLFDQWFDTDDEHVYELLKGRPLAVQPGLLHAYANIGFTLAGLIIEEVSGEDYDTFVRHRIFNPAGMDNSYVHPGEATEALPKGYKGKEAISVPNIRDKAAGGYVISADDMGRFITSLYYSEKILKQETLQQMLTVQNDDVAVDRDFAIGLGFWLIDPFDTGELNASHGGDLPPYHSLLITYPERELAVFVATNDHAKGGVIAMEAGIDILQELLIREGLISSKETTTEYVKADFENTEKFSGQYNTLAGILEVEGDSDNMSIRLGKMKLSLRQTTEGLYKGQFKLFNLIPISIPQLADLEFDLYEAEGKQWIGLWMKGIYMGTGQKLADVVYSDEYENYLGSYKTPEGVNKMEDGSYAISDISIDKLGERYTLSMNLLGQDVQIAIRPDGEGRALTDGAGRAMGDVIEFAEDSKGEITMLWSGFTLMKE